VTAKSAKPWFAPKRYGYGAVPATWQGWVATAVFIVAFGLSMALLQGWLRWMCSAILVGIFAGLACAKTDGGCRWRSGKF
jgi:hypothetical protein